MAELAYVGRYEREMPVSIARMIENALDWEHLPHLHAGSFESIALEAADDGGWRAATTLPGRPDLPLTLDLRLDPDRRGWVTRNFAGDRLASEIRSRAETLADRRIRVTVDFLVAGVAEDRREAAGAYYRALYAQLYDEDEAMMRERQRQLDLARAGDGAAATDLGPRDALRLPLATEFAGRSVRVVEADGELVAHDAVCPHMLGPLDGPVEQGAVTCPWHGYRFDLRTGRETGGRACRLRPGPQVVVGEDRRVRLVAPSSGIGDGA
jgi:nitrite reductase/ring-hydroxylating ferredoxin subunit